MAEIKDPENTILMELKGRHLIIELLPDVAPGHCARMKNWPAPANTTTWCFTA